MGKNKIGTLTASGSVAKLSIISISLLIALKVIASVLTGSIGIRADAIHSVIDLTGAFIGYLAIRLASKPPDERHAYGHGKAENIAGAVIAGLIFVAAGTIVYEAVRRMVVGGSVELLTIGISVIAAAIAINGGISWYALRVAKSNDSLALEATARDMFADVLSSCAVLVGLVLVSMTGLNILDPIVALLVAVLITRTAYSTMKKSVGGLMDTRLPRDEEESISACIAEHGSKVVGFHKLRTRKAGNQRYIELHLVVPKDASVHEAHSVCDHLENDMRKTLPRSNFSIHIEPCTIECVNCSVTCNLKSSI
jgi:cation diffusion facilitator family transporter